jgi:hypothetical protein
MDNKINKPKGLMVTLNPEVNEMLKKAASKKDLSLSEYAYYSIILSLKNDGYDVNSYNYIIQKRIVELSKKYEVIKYFSDKYFVFPKVNHEECNHYLDQNELLTFFNTRKSQLSGLTVQRFLIEFKRYNHLKTKLISIKENGNWRTIRVTPGIIIKQGVVMHGGEE